MTKYNFTPLERFIELEITRRQAIARIDTALLGAFAESMGIESYEGLLPEKLCICIRGANVLRNPFAANCGHTKETGGAFGELVHQFYQWEQSLLVKTIHNEHLPCY